MNSKFVKTDIMQMFNGDGGGAFVSKRTNEQANDKEGPQRIYDNDFNCDPHFVSSRSLCRCCVRHPLQITVQWIDGHHQKE